MLHVSVIDEFFVYLGDTIKDPSCVVTYLRCHLGSEVIIYTACFTYAIANATKYTHEGLTLYINLSALRI